METELVHELKLHKNNQPQKDLKILSNRANYIIRRHRKAEDDFSLKNFFTLLSHPTERQKHIFSNYKLFEI